MTVKAEHVLCVVILAVAGVFAWFGMKKSGGVTQPGTTESYYEISDYDAPILTPWQHLTPTVYTAHRYPDHVGGEVSALLHHGHSIACIPKSSDRVWMTHSPSEEIL
jgi:hypothetical protein